MNQSIERLSVSTKSISQADEEPPSDQTQITYVSFNQDCTCIVLATSKSTVSVFSTNPLNKLYQSPPIDNSVKAAFAIKFVEMQFTGKVLVIVSDLSDTFPVHDRNNQFKKM